MELVREPDLTRHEKRDFLIDGIPISLWLPFNGKEGEYTRHEISTPFENRFEPLISVRYDYAKNGSAGYSLAHFSFGVHKGECCSKGLPAASSTNDGADSGEVTTIEIDANTLIYRVDRNVLGDIRHTYFAPHNSEYSLVFMLAIDQDAPDSESYRNSRITMFRDLVASALNSQTTK